MVKMAIITIHTMWLEEMIKFWRSKSVIISAISAPLAFMIFLAPSFISGFQLRGGGDLDISFFAPGLIGITISMTSIFTNVSIILEKELGIIKAILVAPVGRFSLVLGKAAGGTTIAVMQGIMITIVAIFLGANYVSIIGVLTSIVVMLLLSIGFVGLGIAIASKIDSHMGFQMITSFLTMPIIMLSGAFSPIASLPVWLKSIVYANPLTYGVDALRWSLLGSSTIPISLSLEVLILFAIIMMGIAEKMFGSINVK